MALGDWNWRGSGSSEDGGKDDQTSGIMAFTPSESKRLIAKAVAGMAPVRAALEKGRVVLAGGSTNAFVAEEILGKPIPKEYYLKGSICYGLMCTTRRSDQWVKSHVLIDGVPVDRESEEVLQEFDARDVFIKGANAVDPDRDVGILMANPVGGRTPAALGILMARGSHLIVPVGLEKLIPSVRAAASKCGIHRLRYPDGGTIGLMPVMGATVVTEMEALALLTGVKATHVASGGIGGSEGSVVLVVEGPDERVRKAFELWESIKGEPAVPAPAIAVRYGIDLRSGASR